MDWIRSEESKTTPGFLVQATEWMLVPCAVRDTCDRATERWRVWVLAVSLGASGSDSEAGRSSGPELSECVRTSPAHTQRFLGGGRDTSGVCGLRRQQGCWQNLEELGCSLAQ